MRGLFEVLWIFIDRYSEGPETEEGDHTQRLSEKLLDGLRTAQMCLIRKERED